MQCTTLPYEQCLHNCATDQVGCPVYQAPGYLPICSRPITCRYCASLYNQYINSIQTVLPVAWLPSNTGTLFNLTHDAMVLHCTVPSYLWYCTVFYPVPNDILCRARYPIMWKVVCQVKVWQKKYFFLNIGNKWLEVSHHPLQERQQKAKWAKTERYLNFNIWV